MPRRKPFSNKQKKQQLQQKRQKKKDKEKGEGEQEGGQDFLGYGYLVQGVPCKICSYTIRTGPLQWTPHHTHPSESGSESGEEEESQIVVAKINQQPVTGTNRYDPNRLALWSYHCIITRGHYIISLVTDWSIVMAWVYIFRYRLHFERETRDDIEERKLLAKTAPITSVPEVR